MKKSTTRAVALVLVVVMILALVVIMILALVASMIAPYV